MPPKITSLQNLNYILSMNMDHPRPRKEEIGFERREEARSTGIKIKRAKDWKVRDLKLQDASIGGRNMKLNKCMWLGFEYVWAAVRDKEIKVVSRGREGVLCFLLISLCLK